MVPISSGEAFQRRSGARERIQSLLSNSANYATAIRDQPDTSMELEGKRRRLASAKRVFKKLARSYLDKRVPPDPERVKDLWEYKDVLDLKTVFAWRDEAGIRRGVLYEDGKVEFEVWPVLPHEDIVDIFENIFKSQFVFPWMDPRNPTFEGKHNEDKKASSLRITLMTLDTNFPGKGNSAFVPNPRPDPNNALGNLVQLQPNLNIPWPTIVLEVGNSESVSELIENRNKYLGHTTQVNVYVGVSYNRTVSREMDSWCMCVAYRDINAPQPPPGTPPEYPVPIIVGELQKTAGNRYPVVNLPIPQNASIWSVPTHLLFQPEAVPVMDPPFPPSFDVDIETFRQGIVKHRPPCTSVYSFEAHI